MEKTSVPAPEESVPLPGEDGYSTDTFRIGTSETGGLGMFAERDIQKGTCIVRESDVMVPTQIMREKVIERNTQPETAMPDKSDVTVYGPNIARVNHSCSRWNATYANATTTGRELHAVSRIKKGAEITRCYKTHPILQFTQPDGSLETRATNEVNRCRMSMLLKDNCGFICSCVDCIEDRRVCFVCRKETVGLKRCARCGVVWYCNRVCQVADWKGHKSECLKWSTTREDLQAKAKSSLAPIP
mmetsp:Transcript_4000/g.6691  ORF Transcript_4000/g.6691 Transcript_4000/m.6691 type:complete len:244 (+) Transcript_4000:77-808(+)